MNGRIVKALSGFYYVEAADGIHECRARGIFRKQGQTPLVGDLVEFSLSGKRGTVEAIGPRRNRFVRPAVSNVDLLVLLAAVLVLMTKDNFGSPTEDMWQFGISIFLFVTAFVGTQFFKVSPIRMILLCALAGLLLYY